MNAFREHGDGSSGYRKVEEFRNQLSNCRRLKSDSVPLSHLASNMISNVQNACIKDSTNSTSTIVPNVKLILTFTKNKIRPRLEEMRSFLHLKLCLLPTILFFIKKTF